MALIRKTRWLRRLASVATALTLVLALSAPARADFFDEARRTFQTDIPHFFQTDLPHFFQDDIPCAFGGQPTSHTRASCKSTDHPGKPATDKKPVAPPAATKPSEGQAAGASSGR